jgi:tetratricopeptide (TPR) repeat protein
MHVWRGVLGAILLAAFAVPAQAQLSGRVAGTVRDEMGQPIKGATVTAEFLDAGVVNGATAISDEKGRFSMVGLRFGEWLFAAQAPGFHSQNVSRTVRTAGANAPLSFILEKSVVPPSALGGVSPKDLQLSLSTANDLFNAQRWDEAIAAYRAVLAQAPSLSSINMQIAAAYRSKKEYDLAIAAYNDLLKVDPASEKAKLGIAMTHLEKGDVDAAEKTIEAAAQSPSATRDVFYDLGQLKMARSQPDAAAAAYERAVQMDRTWGKPALALGRLAMNKGDEAGAVKYFQTVIDVDPMSPEAVQAKALIAQIKK